jgi:hypothetical protein
VSKLQIASLVADVFSNVEIAENKVLLKLIRMCISMPMPVISFPQ